MHSISRLCVFLKRDEIYKYINKCDKRAHHHHPKIDLTNYIRREIIHNNAIPNDEVGLEPRCDYMLWY